MKNKNLYCILVGVAFFISACKKEIKEIAPIKIAFLSDVHLQDIYADFSDTDYKGVLDSKTGKYYTIRTMESQLHSTRLFNENYFAFIAALDDLVSKNITLVVLPGDFSDDSQPINIKALKRILDSYQKKYGMQFFLTTGNHDPVHPFSEDGGKYDFLGEAGKKQAIVSDSSLIKYTTEELPTIVTKGIQKWGYKEIAEELSDFGFYPRKEFLYWETPNTTYAYENYKLEKAVAASSLDKRTYTIENSLLAIPDMSYLVEPVEGLWLLAIDGNVYIPKESSTERPLDKIEFSSASVGYNNVLTHKKHLVTWAKKVADEAKRKGKTLIAFSHYPMVEFNDGASEEMRSLFGNKMQAHRIPNTLVPEIFADAGIQIHFGGHMHLNDTGVFTSKKGNTLFNIQVPSLAAYIPAYKILTIKSNAEFKIETKEIEEVKDYDSFFLEYEKEYEHLKNSNRSRLWSKEILSAKNYKAYTKKHLEGLVEARFLPKDWPENFSKKLTLSTGKDLLLSIKAQDKDSLQVQLNKSGLTLVDFEAWKGMDMIYDFYRLRSADALAVPDIGRHKMKQYMLLCSELKKSDDVEMVLWANLFYKFCNGAPSVNFTIDLNSNTIRSLPIN